MWPRSSAALFAIFVAVALARPAAAQTFPSGNAWVALPCGGGIMTDPANDTPNATGALDIVGRDPQAAGFHAADGTFLYLRLRVAANAINGGRFLRDAWGWEIDLDGDRSTYELIFSVSGTGMSDAVAIYRHPTTQTPGNPAEPAQTPPAFTYPASTHAEVVAAGSSLGGAADYFVDIALPWADLATVGVTRATAVHVWAGTSTLPNALDLDLACFSGTGGTLGGIDVGVTTPDPQGGGGGGSGGTGGAGGRGGTGPRTLEGGPGCSVGGAGDRTTTTGALLLLSLLALPLALVFARGARRR